MPQGVAFENDSGWILECWEVPFGRGDLFYPRSDYSIEEPFVKMDSSRTKDSSQILDLPPELMRLDNARFRFVNESECFPRNDVEGVDSNCFKEVESVDWISFGQMASAALSKFTIGYASSERDLEGVRYL
jgi:hypothetical protein